MEFFALLRNKNLHKNFDAIVLYGSSVKARRNSTSNDIDLAFLYRRGLSKKAVAVVRDECLRLQKDFETYNRVNIHSGGLKMLPGFDQEEKRKALAFLARKP